MNLVDKLIAAKRLTMTDPCLCEGPEPTDTSDYTCTECGKTIPWLDSGEVVAAWLARGWVHESCGCCAGIEWGGEEPRDCRRCDGSGQVWRSPKGKYAKFPGGPWCG